MIASLPKLNFAEIEDTINNIAFELERGTDSTENSSEGESSPKCFPKVELPKPEEEAAVKETV